jgi:hypothetical protein
MPGFDRVPRETVQVWWANDTGIVQAVVVTADGHLEQPRFGRVEQRAAEIGENDQDEDEDEGVRVRRT